MNIYKLLQCSLLITLSLFLFTGCADQKDKVQISTDTEDPKIRFAIKEIESASVSVSGKKKILIKLSVRPESPALQPEGFSIKKEGNTIHVTGADAAGAMYGGLELAEQIRIYGLDGIRETTQNPYMRMRGTKFNIPLDARTPTYTHPCDAARENLPEMWSFDFWKSYIDNLARYRYNFISLWSLHPFPSLVRVPDYPDVALDDVHRSTQEWPEYNSLRAIGFYDPEMLEDPEIVKQIPVEKKIGFWKKVMKYAGERNIDFYVITWNIYTNGTEGKYGITGDIDNPVTRDYFRKSVRQMFLTYPDLAGIGLTTGENMMGADFEEREDWAFETYARGAMDAAAEMPGRRITFVHRQHMTGARDIARKFKPLSEHGNIDFIFSFKYAKAHVLSATRQPYHRGFVKEIGGLETIWTLRNDDNYYFRWGAPGFVREFIRNIPYDVSRGFYYGSDQWVWGREFLMKDPEKPRQIEIVKHWYHWMMWGRLGYDPEMPDQRFIDVLQERFPQVNGRKLFTAWQEASMIYPATTGFHWGLLDFQWYIEACKSRPSYAQNETGFHDVNRFISLPPHPESGFQSIPDFVQMTVKGETSDLESPFEVAAKLHAHAGKALKLLQEMDPGEEGNKSRGSSSRVSSSGGNNPEANENAQTGKELEITLNDIKTMAFLGKYYAHKIEGSTNVALYRETRDKKYRDEAIGQLTTALEFWEKYTGTALKQNINPVWLNRVGYVDWKEITGWVKQDIEIARSALN